MTALAQQIAAEVKKQLSDAGSLFVAVPYGAPAPPVTPPALGRTVPNATAYLFNNAVANVRDYGANGTGLIDDTAAIQAAMNSLAASGGTLEFPQGVYLISAEIQGVSNVRIHGANAQINSGATRLRSYFAFINQSNVIVDGLTFDLGQSRLPVYTLADYNAAVYPGSVYSVGLYSDGSANLTVERCVFQNLYTKAIFLIHTTGFVKVRQNRFASPVQVQKIHAEHIGFGSSGMHLTVFDNDFDNAAPPSADFGVPACYGANNSDATLSSFRFLYNRTNYCGRNSVGGHQLATVSSYGDVRNFQVIGNIMLNNLQQVIRVTCAWTVDVSKNDATMASIAGDADQMVSVEGTWAFFPGLVGVKDVRIHHNSFRDDYGTQRIGVLVISYDWSIPSEDVDVHDNTFYNMKFALEVQGPYTNLKFRHNTIRGANGGSVWVLHNAAITAAHGVTEAQSAFRDLAIVDNVWDLPASGAVAVFVDFTKAPVYTGSVGETDLSGNRFRMAALGAATCIVGRGVAGAPQGVVRCRDNRAELFATMFDIANFSDVMLVDSKAVSCTTFRVNVGSNTTESVDGNRRSAGALKGRIVLVGGVTAVPTIDAAAGDNVELTVQAIGGAPGLLSIGAINPGVSFTILSSNAGDASTVFWRIVH